MDIYSAEIQVKKLLNYVQSLSDSKSRMYQKSKDRLKELANTCNQVVAVISQLIQDEALVNSDSDEFSRSDPTDFKSVLDSMESQIAELRQFIEPPKQNSSNLISTNDRKKALFAYKTCLNTLSNSSMKVLEAEDCSRLIWNWFSARFLNTSSTFRYNMKKLPSWIRDIVIFYGYHVENRSVAKFKSDFNSWIDSIRTGNNYAVPYEIYQFEKSPNPEIVTLTSVVLWDLLLDGGLRQLCCDNSDIYPSEECVYSLVGKLDSNVMNPYTNYNYDTDILRKCNLTIKVGDVR